MVKPEWGTKRSCPKCGTRFYDLGADEPVVCIECGNQWSPEPVLKSKQQIPYEEEKKAETEEEGVASPAAFNSRSGRLTTLADLRDFIVAEGRKGAYVQRYKGLGEMNPDQLAETTMEADKRTLLKIEIQDAIETDLLFSCLMGDDVEPRRDFIQSNALNVKNLDA